MIRRRIRNRIQASALGYAISFLMLIGLICSGVLIVASTNKRIEMNYTISEHMLFNNYLGIHYGARMDKPESRQIMHPSGDTTVVVAKDWGAYRVIVSNTHHKAKEVKRSAMVGYTPVSKLPALYLPDHNQKLSVCGKTKIEGDAWISERGVSRGHIAGQHYSGKELIYGKQYKSERHLPPIQTDLQSLYNNLKTGATKIEGCDHDSSYSFLERTSLYSSLSPIHLRSKLDGNLLIHSFDSIFVSSSASLKHIILMAPVIYFESGFQGNVQAVASKRITCEKEVQLDYPSALILQENETAVNRAHGIFLNEDSQVLGGVLLTAEHPDFRKPIRLELLHGTIGGLVYNSGETDVQGKIIGSLYTNAISLYAGGGSYGNHLLNATISYDQLPNDFAIPRWIKSEEESTPIILACF